MADDRSEAGRHLVGLRTWEKRMFVCDVCGQTFESNGSRAKYCSGLCRWKAWKKRKAEQGQIEVNPGE